MNARVPWAAAAALVLIAACGDKKPAAPAPRLPAAAPAVAAPAAAAPAVKQADAPAAEWTYTSVGKRDPFRSFLLDEAASSRDSILTRCNTPLGRFDMEQLRVVAVITGLADPVAMVEAPNGIGYALHRGSCIGRNGGVVSTVRTGEVVVAEWAVRADGKRERAQTLLRLPREPELRIEE